MRLATLGWPAPEPVPGWQPRRPPRKALRAPLDSSAKPIVPTNYGNMSCGDCPAGKTIGSAVDVGFSHHAGHNVRGILATQSPDRGWSGPAAAKPLGLHRQSDPRRLGGQFRPFDRHELCARPPSNRKIRPVCGRHLSPCGVRSNIVLMLVVRCGGLCKNRKRRFDDFRNCRRALELGRLW